MSEMMQVARNYWLSPKYADPEVVRDLAEATTLPEHFCHLLVQRGVVEKEAARAFLRPETSQLHDPFLMKGMGDIVRELLAARERGDTIGVHGDYDVDGLTSTTVYTQVLRKLGYEVVPFVPHRMIDGYGVADRAIEQFAEAGVKVVLTCDVGFSAVKQVRGAVDDLGMRVLVTDHHLPPEGELPPAHALVNPHQDGCNYPFKNLCGAAVAYHVMRALVQAMGQDFIVLEQAQGQVLSDADLAWLQESLAEMRVAEARPGDKESARLARELRARIARRGFTPFDEKGVLEPHLDVVALGTVADVMPLVGENRALVKAGIDQARQTRNLGLRTLCDVVSLAPEKLDEHKFGWVIGPHFNAAGRISDATKGLELLLTEDPERALAIARELATINDERKKLTKAIEKDAYARIDQMDLDDVYGIVLCGEQGSTPEWHHGVIGIVAGWVKERYTRAVLLMAWDPESGRFKGSGRAPAVGNVHLKNALQACAEHLEGFGGHPVAAGFTVKGTRPEDIEAFRQALNEAIRQQMTPEQRIPALAADLEVSLDQVDKRLYKAIQWLQPFGPSNANVSMIARGVTVLGHRILKSKSGGQGLKMQVSQNGRTMEALSWDLLDVYPELATRETPYEADLFFRVRENDWRRQRDPFADTELEIELKDMRLPHTITLPEEARLNAERMKPTPAIPLTGVEIRRPGVESDEQAPVKKARASRKKSVAAS
jgi:single-stranded-DNA-specific exonuclease